MSNKKILAFTAFALLFSQQSFASETEGFYFGGGYYGQFFNSTGSLKVEQKVKEDKKDGNFTINETSIGWKIKGRKPSEYKADYNQPFAGGIAFGYKGAFGNYASYRADLEAMHSSVKADNVGLEGSQTSVSYLKKTGTNDSKKTYVYTAKVDNDQIKNTSVMANAYYHLRNDNLAFSPYVGAGIGLTRMKMFGAQSIRPAYQLKAGLDCAINESVSMYVGYRHFGAFGADYKLKANVLGEIKPGTPGSKSKLDSSVISGLSDSLKRDDINIGVGLFTTHGLEAGLTFDFASQS